MQRKLISGGEKVDIRPIHHRTDAIHADFHSICYTLLMPRLATKTNLFNFTITITVEHATQLDSYFDFEQ